MQREPVTEQVEYNEESIHASLTASTQAIMLTLILRPGLKPNTQVLLVHYVNLLLTTTIYRILYTKL